MDRWEGKTAVVTGASAGIGAAICVRLAAAGMRVVGLARRPQLVEALNDKLPGGCKVYARQCDVGKPEELAEAFKWIEREFGGTDLLVNNAAVLPAGHITDFGGKAMNEEELRQCVDINVTGTMLAARHAVASMRARGVDGHIVNINSVAGHYVPTQSVANVYPATKHAITAFTTSLVDELAHLGARIKTTSISPGLVETAMALSVLGMLPVPATPMPMLRPDDVAGAVLYAVSTPPDVNILELTITPVAERRV